MEECKNGAASHSPTCQNSAVILPLVIIMQNYALSHLPVYRMSPPPFDTNICVMGGNFLSIRSSSPSVIIMPSAASCRQRTNHFFLFSSAERPNIRESLARSGGKLSLLKSWLKFQRFCTVSYLLTLRFQFHVKMNNHEIE